MFIGWKSKWQTFSSDSSPAYGEAVAARGSLGRMRGIEVLPALVGLLRD